MTIIKSKILLLTPLLFAMYGCSSDDTTPAPKPVTSGLFIDAEVEGLSYTTSSGITGVTDENGTYEYRTDDTISFSVGGVNLGEVPGAPICTPYDFDPDEFNTQTSTNIARFLQSLDIDGDPSNGIDLTAANDSLAGTTISSDLFNTDTATFEAGIGDAVTDGGGTLIEEADAITNLVAGTDSTFLNSELTNKVFVALDPADNSLGVLSFSGTGPGTVDSIFPEDTLLGGGDGSAYVEDWLVNADGELILTNNGDTTTVNRVGGSTRSISITYSENGAPALPATLLIPRTVTAADLGGDGTTVASKTYDAVDYFDDAFEIVFDSNGEFAINDGTGDAGFYTVDNSSGNNIIYIHDDEVPGQDSFVSMIILLNAFPAIGETATMLIVDATLTAGTLANPTFSYEGMGLGSIKLKSVTEAPPPV